LLFLVVVLLLMNTCQQRDCWVTAVDQNQCAVDAPDILAAVLLLLRQRRRMVPNATGHGSSVTGTQAWPQLWASTQFEMAVELLLLLLPLLALLLPHPLTRWEAYRWVFSSSR
jgi:hypothetical protein